MADWTAEEVADAVLEHLAIKAAGVSAAPEDRAKALTGYLSIYERLAKRGHAPWPNDEVPIEAQEPLAQYIAGRLAVKFGHSGQRLMEIQGDAREGRKELVEVAAGFHSRLRTQGRYF